MKYKGDDVTRKTKLKQEIVKEYYENGKIEKAKKTNVFSGKRTEPPFVKLYLSDIEILYKLPKKTGDFLYELLSVMNYEGEITINSFMKKRICKTLNLRNERTINNYLSKMVEVNVLSRICRGVYIMNPYLIAKGDFESIEGLRVLYKKSGERIIEVIRSNEIDLEEYEAEEQQD